MKDFALYFLIFMSYGFGGWLLEVVVSLIRRRKFINRGFMIGPICPIYGVGAGLLSLVVNAAESPLVIFCVALVGSATLEYVVSYAMERIFRVRWWDYSDRAFNLNGRICAESLLAFGVLGVVALKIINPALTNFYGAMPEMLMFILAGAIGLWFIFDYVLSLWLMFGVRIAVGTVQRDATDEIAARVREILMGKGKLSRRLMKAFPNQIPAAKVKKKRR